jgi:hypothetical protein
VRLLRLLLLRLLVAAAPAASAAACGCACCGGGSGCGCPRLMTLSVKPAWVDAPFVLEELLLLQTQYGAFSKDKDKKSIGRNTACASFPP